MHSERRLSGTLTRPSVGSLWRNVGALSITLALTACGQRDIVVGTLSDGSAQQPDGSAQQPFVPFGVPTLVQGILDPTDTVADPSLSKDMLQLYFASNKNNTWDIWTTTRASLNAPWNPAVVVSELSADTYEAEPSISGDGLTIWFSSNRPDASLNVNHIWVSHRPTLVDSWSAPEVMDWGSDSDRGPSTDITDLNFVFYSTRVTSNHADLFIASRESRSATWSAPRNLSEVNSSATDWDPGLFANGLGLMFASTRDGGTVDPALYESARPSLDAPFSPPQIHSELNTPEAQGDPWVSNDGKYIIFSSTRNGKDISRLFEARR